MLVTFTSKAHADITMFGEVAVTLLKMMGYSGSVPGAMMAEDIAPALEHLQAALTKAAATEAKEMGNEEEPPVSISVRAMPLIELMQASQQQRTYISWSNN